MPKNNKYKPGNPEYDFWNDKNLYPSLRNDYDADFSSHPQQPSNPNDTKVQLGSVFGVVFGWIVLLAPFALFLTWQDWIVQVIFWGGVVIITLTFSLWLYGAIQEYYQKKNPPQKPWEDPNLPTYKKYPPADVIKDRKK